MSRSTSLSNTTFYPSLLLSPSIIMFSHILTNACGGLHRTQKARLSSYHVFFWVRCDNSNLNDPVWLYIHTIFRKFILWIHMDLHYSQSLPYNISDLAAVAYNLCLSVHVYHNCLSTPPFPQSSFSLCHIFINHIILLKYESKYFHSLHLGTTISSSDLIRLFLL